MIFNVKKVQYLFFLFFISFSLPPPPPAIVLSTVKCLLIYVDLVAKLMELNLFLSCRLLDTKIGVNSLFLRKVPKWSRKYFFENFKKYSPKDQVKSYSEKVLTLWFSLEMYLKNKFEEDPLCENSTCHKNKAVSIFSNTALFLKL